MSAGGGRRFVAGVTGAVLTFAALAVLAAAGALAAYVAPGPVARGRAPATSVVLRRGAHVQEIAAALKRGGVIASTPAFIVAAELTGAARRLKSGEYLVPSRASLGAVLKRLRSGEIVHHHVTIAEGITSQAAVDVLRASDVLTGDVPTPPEGALLPETYDVVRGDSRSAVLQRMMDDRDRLLAALWAKRQPGLPYASPQDAVTMASIVEKETALPAERPRVAAVYVNRLRAGMLLAADPTLIYGISRGRPLGRGLTRGELAADTPYNTYLHPGLPPTPIADPGRASLAAVLDPPHTQELYFVADGTGGHAFARTAAEQDANVAKWRAIEKSRAAARTTRTTRTTTTTHAVTTSRGPDHAR